MSFYLGAYWGPRREDDAECARRLGRCLEAIATYSPLFADWYDVRDGVTAAAPPPADWVIVPRSDDSLAKRLRRGVNRRDTTGEPVHELGFSLRLWNLKEREAGGGNLSVHCGGCSEHLLNSFLLDLPPRQIEPGVYQPPTARGLMEAVIDCWQPDWATWTSRALRRLQRRDDTAPAKPLGWATYFSARPGSAHDLPPGAALHALGRGWLLTIGDDPADVPADLVLAVRDSLGEQALA